MRDESSGVENKREEEQAPEAALTQSDDGAGDGNVPARDDAAQPDESGVEVRSAEEVDAEAADEEPEPFVYVPKLTEKQQKLWQTVTGLACGFLVMFTMWLNTLDTENQLLTWLFLLVFLAVMIIRNQVEKRTGIRLTTFTKFFIISLAVCLGLFVLWGAVTGKFSEPA